MKGLPKGAQYYTVEEVAAHLRMAKMSVYRMLHRGDIPSIRFGGRMYRIPAADFDAWEAEQLRKGML